MEPQSATQKYGRDFLASFVVFLVALPLCMGIAIASGVPVGAGLITGIIGGIIVGSIAGSPLQVSGPAAGLTVIIVGIVQDPELGLPMLGLVVLGGGLLQITAGALRLGQWFRAISPTVIAGMLAGIGVIIFSSQFHVMVDDTPRAGPLQNLISIPNAIYKGVTPTEETYHHHAAWIGLLTIVSLVGWNAFRPKKLKVVPGPLVGVLVGAGVSQIFGYEQILYVELPASLVDAITWPQVGDWSFIQS
ncbi:MAG: SulP family inorganic anion transporter, partial [Planctomycetota bacterium]|nr:SulP family inorganic anion transporter [Planctomycetota bacterium]